MYKTLSVEMYRESFMLLAHLFMVGNQLSAQRSGYGGPDFLHFGQEPKDKKSMLDGWMVSKDKRRINSLSVYIWTVF